MLSDGGQSISTTSNRSRTGRSASRSRCSRPMGIERSCTSAAVRSWFDGSSDRPGICSGRIASAAVHAPTSTSPAPRSIEDLSTPQPMVALPCGSRSISSTRRRVAASEAARFTAVVVLPTPPFWFATAMTRFMLRV